MMFKLLTLPGTVPYDSETRPTLVLERTDEPVGIIIRPGPVITRPVATLRATLAAARG